jgi:tetratricopeptide (TPR) repeat protein
MRNGLTWTLNIIAPGAGLILARREWLGVALAILYTGAIQVVLILNFIAPTVVPPSIKLTAAAAAALLWLWAQWLLLRRLRSRFGPDAAKRLAVLCEEARHAESEGRIDEAYELLKAALTMNDENVQIARQWAALLRKMGRSKAAVQAARRVRYLARTHDEKLQAAAALNALMSSESNPDECRSPSPKDATTSDKV